MRVGDRITFAKLRKQTTIVVVLVVVCVEDWQIQRETAKTVEAKKARFFPAFSCPYHYVFEGITSRD
jgi:hypothetical protein